MSTANASMVELSDEQLLSVAGGSEGGPGEGDDGAWRDDPVICETTMTEYGPYHDCRFGGWGY